MPHFAQQPRIHVRPDRLRLLSEPMERCGHCMQLWPSSDMVETVQANRPFRVCPNGASPSTDIEFETEFREQAADELEFLIAYPPRMSLAQMELIIPSTLVSMEDSSGNAVNSVHPLALLRSGSNVLVLKGVNFTAGDVVAMPTGITISSSVLTSTQKTLTLLAAVDAPRGAFSFTFNDDTHRSVLQVR